MALESFAKYFSARALLQFPQAPILAQVQRNSRAHFVPDGRPSRHSRKTRRRSRSILKLESAISSQNHRLTWAVSLGANSVNANIFFWVNDPNMRAAGTVARTNEPSLKLTS